MVEPLREGVALFLLAVGVFFSFAGAVGILRFPDVYNRLQAATKNTTLGLLSILLAGVVALGFEAVTLKALAIVVFLLLTFPVSGHLLARAAYRTGVPLAEETLHDEYRHVLALREGAEEETGEPRPSPRPPR